MPFPASESMQNPGSSSFYVRVLISSFDVICFFLVLFSGNLITGKYSLLFLKALPWIYRKLLNFCSAVMSGRHFLIRRLLLRPWTALYIYLSLSYSQQNIVREVFQLNYMKYGHVTGNSFTNICHYITPELPLTDYSGDKSTDCLFRWGM
jgi:hypothetical protein